MRIIDYETLAFPIEAENFENSVVLLNFEDKAKDVYKRQDFRPQVFYADAVAWAEAKGIIKNSGDNRFGGDGPCTRVEMARYMYYAYN